MLFSKGARHVDGTVSANILASTPLSRACPQGHVSRMQSRSLAPSRRGRSYISDRVEIYRSPRQGAISHLAVWLGKGDLQRFPQARPRNAMKGKRQRESVGAEAIAAGRTTRKPCLRLRP